MNTSVQVISHFQLALAFIPVIVVLLMMVRWSLKAGFAVYALIRMLIQLLLVGYVLTTVFAAEQSWIVMLVMLVMVSTASWIALGTVKDQRRALYPVVFISILLGSGLTLLLITQSVIGLSPWY